MLPGLYEAYQVLDGMETSQVQEGLASARGALLDRFLFRRKLDSVWNNTDRVPQAELSDGIRLVFAQCMYAVCALEVVILKKPASKALSARGDLQGGGIEHAMQRNDGRTPALTPPAMACIGWIHP